MVHEKLTDEQKATRKKTLDALMDSKGWQVSDVVAKLPHGQDKKVWTGWMYNARSKGVKNFPTAERIKILAPIFGVSEEDMLNTEKAWTASTAPSVNGTGKDHTPKTKIGKTFAKLLVDRHKGVANVASDLSKSGDETPLLEAALNGLLIDEKPDPVLNLINRLADEYSLDPADLTFDPASAAKPANPKPAPKPARPAARTAHKPTSKPAAKTPPAKPAAKPLSPAIVSGAAKLAAAVKTTEGIPVTRSIAGKLITLGLLIQRDLKGYLIRLPAGFMSDLLWEEATGTKPAGTIKPAVSKDQGETKTGLPVNASVVGKLSNEKGLEITREEKAYVIRLPADLMTDILWRARTNAKSE